MPLADFALTILICHSPVDEFKHAGRKEAIRATWGSARQRVGGWKVHSYFVEPKPPVEAELARDELFAPDGLAPTEQFVWAVRAIHAVSGGHPRHWFFRAETITFVRVPMLCALLERQSRSSGEGAPDADPRRGPRPLFVGRVLRTDAPPAGETFLSGGAGFALNNAAADALLRAWDTSWAARVRTDKWLGTATDIALVRALATEGVHPISARDPGSDLDYLHPYTPARTVDADFDDWFVKYAKNAAEPVVGGERCCAEGSATFHYVEAKSTRFLHDVLTSRSLWRSTGESQRQRQWPADDGYDRAPKGGKAAMAAAWHLLLDVLGDEPQRGAGRGGRQPRRLPVEAKTET